MARVKVPAGTVQKFEQVFDDLQTNQKANVKLQFETILNETFGNVVELNNGNIVGNSFQVTASPTNTNPRNITIQPGTALTRSGDTIKVTAPYSTDISLSTPNTYVLVKIAYNEVGGSSITAMNSFLYDTTGTSAYSTKYTRYTDSFQLTFTIITPGAG